MKLDYNFVQELSSIFTGDSMTGTADKYYTVSSDPTYTDVSAVKLTWSVPTLTYTSGTNKVTPDWAKLGAENGTRTKLGTYTEGATSVTATQAITVKAAGPDLSDSTKAVTLTVAQLEAAKADSTQTDYLKAYANTGLLKTNGVLAADSAATATLVNYNDDGSLTFMTDENVATSIVKSSYAGTDNFSNTELYPKLQEGGEIYNLYSTDALNKIIAQDKLVAAKYDDEAGVDLATLSSQKLWLPSYSEVLGESYGASYNAGSTVEGTQMSAFKSGSSYAAWKSGTWFLRSAFCGYDGYWLSVWDGWGSTAYIDRDYGVRPCFTL